MKIIWIRGKLPGSATLVKRRSPLTLGSFFRNLVQRTKAGRLAHSPQQRPGPGRTAPCARLHDRTGTPGAAAASRTGTAGTATAHPGTAGTAAAVSCHGTTGAAAAAQMSATTDFTAGILVRTGAEGTAAAS